MALIIKAYRIKITGIVQGVGFRPFVYGLAKSLSLCGKVWNEGADVDILVEGSSDILDAFVKILKEDAPVLSKINTIIIDKVDVEGFTDFLIMESLKGARSSIYISPDTGICRECVEEMLHNENFRYLYPFINCTNCGPRFTIIKGIPYDRSFTTMASFKMCDECKTEYLDPLNRRYHAQPVCCPKCGPRVELIDSKGNEAILQHHCEGITDENSVNVDSVKRTVQLLKQGKIIAVKGLGGFHLVCDGTNEDAVRELRKRKHRDDKPFALMMKDIQVVKKYCEVDLTEERLLMSEKKPIVLLKKKGSKFENIDSVIGGVCQIAKGVADGNPNLGVMMPYTPLHILLFEQEKLNDVMDSNVGIEVLVATSGNISNEPIVYENGEAFDKLSGIADYFLVNNRDIFIRTDDSVTRVFNNKEYIVRRARGYVPMPIRVQEFDAKAPQILACGGELKNTFCLNKGPDFFPSHHIGDLENAETLKSFEDGIEHFKRMFEIEPEVIAFDLHPEYLSTKYAKRLDIEKKVGIQHHHAHIASCMAENEVQGDVIGVAFDGTGYGLDGHIWGGEFFVGGYSKFERAAHLDYVRLIGGEKAVKEPWRMAVSYLKSVGRMSFDYYFDKANYFNTSNKEMEVVLNMHDKKFNSPLTSSAGRLFDAVSALCGVRNKIAYEGQAAIEFEQLADLSYNKPFGFTLDYCRDLNNSIGRGTFKKVRASEKIQSEQSSCGSCYIIKPQEMFLEIANLIEMGSSVGEISGRFHYTIAKIILDTCNQIRKDTGISQAVLSGGVFQNITLLSLAVKQLESNGFRVYTHSRVPANDGGISLGQAVIAGFGGGYYV